MCCCFGFQVIVNKLQHNKVVGRWSVDHLQTTYQLPTDHLPSNHLPTTYRLLYLPTIFFTVQLVQYYLGSNPSLEQIGKLLID